MKKMNKRGDVAILALVIFSVILFGMALYVFNTHTDKITGQIEDARFLNSMYLKESQIDFYVNEAIDRTVEGGFVESSGFILGLKNNLRMYDKEDISVREDLLRIVEEIDESDVQFGERVVVSINIQIVDKTDEIITTYNYNKQFVR